MGACSSKHQPEHEHKPNQYQYTFREVPDEEAEKSPSPSVIYARTESKVPGRKVCIIGAGPAGIHMASLLIKVGYASDQIILLEKENRCCGKSMTTPDPDNPQYTVQSPPNIASPNHYHGHAIVHEMGTCYLHPEYHIISQLVAEYDPTNIEVPFCAGDVFGTDYNKKHQNEDNIAFSDWVLTEIKGKVKEKGVRGIPEKYLDKIPHFIAGGAGFEVAVKKYEKVWEEICGKRLSTSKKVRSFPGKPSPENMKRLDCTYFDFLVANGLEPLIPALLYSQAMQGYGILDRIPAWYGLLWTTPELLKASANIVRVAMDSSNVIVLSKGYEHLWYQMVLKHKMDIVYNVDVTEIDRDLENNGSGQKKTRIKYRIRDDRIDEKEEDTKYDNEQVLDVDVLFLACGCKKALSFLTDATEEEKEIFGSISPATLCASLFEYDVNPKLATHKRGGDLWPDNIWAGDDSMYAYRNSLKSIVGEDQYNEWVKQKQLRRDRGMAYQYHTEAPNPEIDGPKLEKQLIKELSEMGETNVKIIQQRVWDYFPKWNVKDIVEKEYPWYVKDELQGKYNKTFYIGSSVCMESVLNVCEYNVELANSWYFENDSDVFYCKKRLTQQNPPFGHYSTAIW